MTIDDAAPPGMVRNWAFQPSAASLRTIATRAWRGTAHRRPPPAWQTLVAMRPARRWIGYFIFAPDGGLSPHHTFTLACLRAHDAKIAVVCATRAPDAMPRELASLSDALYWKALGGYDFSAYAILVAEAARHSAGADLIVMNDSVLGPFDDLYGVYNRLPQRFAGLTGYSLIENHIQSYSFRLRSVDGAAVNAMHPIAGETRAFNAFLDVTYCQETRFTRAMARGHDAGALWFSDHRQGGGDLPLTWPLGLIDEGFPFLKRSLFTKFKSMCDEPTLQEFLARKGHPSG